MTSGIVYLRDKNTVDLVLNSDGSIVNTTSLSGLTVTISGGVNVSGATVRLVQGDLSGVNVTLTPSQISGLNVTLTPGQISGVNVFIQANAISGNKVSLTQGDLSGVNVKLTVGDISGQQVFIQGNAISGNTVKLTQGDLSGVNVTLTPAQISGVNVFTQANNISGQNVKEYGSSVTAAASVTITSLSGGTTLGSGAIFKLLIRSQSGNRVMYIGAPSGSGSANSGVGVELYGGESIMLPMNNLNTVNLYATVSGEKVSYLGMV